MDRVSQPVSKPPSQLSLRVLGFALIGAFAFSTPSSARVASQDGSLSFGDEKFRLTVELAPAQTGIPAGQKTLPPTSTKDYQRFAAIFIDINELIRPLKAPTQVTLLVNQVELSPRASSPDNTIYMGVRFGRMTREGKVFTQNPSVMTGVAAHEYGHIIFAENILSRIPFYQETLKQSQELQQIQDILLDLQDRYNKIAKRVNAGDRNPARLAEAAKLKREAMEWLEEGKRLGAMQNQAWTLIRNHTSSYNEFFADVVALLYTEEPQTIRDAIHFSMPDDMSPSDRRRIESELNARSFEKRGTGPVVILSHHGVFGETRNVVWDEFLSRPTILRQRKSEVVVGVARAIIAELEWKLANPKILPLENRELVNRRLSERIRLQLRSLK